MRIKSLIRRVGLPCLTVTILFFRQASAPGQTSDSSNLLSTWLNSQTNIQAWSADFTQVRTLKALTKPLSSTEHVWFAAPNRFHWELGHPPQTIAVRDADQLMVIYPKLKRAERYSLGGAQATEWKDTLALLDAGFPRSRAEVESRFNILSQSTANGIHTLTLQPKSEAARKFMPQIKISFDTTSFALHSTELQFQDGSTMENIFSNPQLNAKIDEQMFHPSVEGYKIVEPFKK